VSVSISLSYRGLQVAAEQGEGRHQSERHSKTSTRLLFVLVLGDEREHIRHLVTIKLQYTCPPICMAFAHQVCHSLARSLARSWLSPKRLIRVLRIAPFPPRPPLRCFLCLFTLTYGQTYRLRQTCLGRGARGNGPCARGDQLRHDRISDEKRQDTQSRLSPQKKWDPVKTRVGYFSAASPAVSFNAPRPTSQSRLRVFPIGPTRRTNRRAAIASHAAHREHPEPHMDAT